MARYAEGRNQRRRWITIAALALVLGGRQALAAWRDSHGLLINTSLSLPNWAFWIERGAMPVRGDYVVFRPPLTRLVTSHFGAAPAPFAKIVYGIAGDTVTRNGTTVAINGKPVGTLKPRTRRGEILGLGPTGIIPRGCYYVGTPHRDGFDSRYADIGFVCSRQIVGTGVPIL